MLIPNVDLESKSKCLLQSISKIEKLNKTAVYLHDENIQNHSFSLALQQTLHLARYQPIRVFLNCLSSLILLYVLAFETACKLANFQNNTIKCIISADFIDKILYGAIRSCFSDHLYLKCQGLTNKSNPKNSVQFVAQQSSLNYKESLKIKYISNYPKKTQCKR